MATPTTPMSIERLAIHESTVRATLFAWFSPAFPTGGFAWSHGLESAVADGRIVGEAGLGDWLDAILGWGGGFTDAVLLNAAHRAAPEDLAGIAELAAALASSRERSAETLGQGAAFTRAVAAGWPHLVAPGLPDPVAYPVAAGAATARLGADATTALVAYLTGFCANLIAAGVRLGLCGQSGGVRILAGLTARIVEIAARAAASSLDDLGACAMGSDIAAMRHETLTTRLFIS